MSKEQSAEVLYSSKNDPNTAIKTIPDNLARLLQMTSQGCTAACFINNKMFISDNDINIKTRDNTPKLSLVTNVMKYFKDLAKNGSKENREKIFIEICTKRIRGEEQGYIKLEDKEIEDIAREVLKNSKAWPNINEKNFPGEKQPYAGALCWSSLRNC